MTQVDQKTYERYEYTQSIATYTFYFYASDATYVRVRKYDGKNPFGITELVLNTDYSVQLNSDNIGGNVTILIPLVPTLGESVWIHVYLFEPFENVISSPILYRPDLDEEQKDNEIRLIQINRDGIEDLNYKLEELISQGIIDIDADVARAEAAADRAEAAAAEAEAAARAAEQSEIQAGLSADAATNAAIAAEQSALNAEISANLAKDYSEQAANSAEDAQQSELQAKLSAAIAAREAQNAANEANRSENAANSSQNSANEAAISAEEAKSSATQSAIDATVAAEAAEDAVAAADEAKQSLAEVREVQYITGETGVVSGCELVYTGDFGAEMTFVVTSGVLNYTYYSSSTNEYITDIVNYAGDFFNFATDQYVSLVYNSGSKVVSLVRETVEPIVYDPLRIYLGYIRYGNWAINKRPLRTAFYDQFKKEQESEGAKCSSIISGSGTSINLSSGYLTAFGVGDESNYNAVTVPAASTIAYTLINQSGDVVSTPIFNIVPANNYGYFIFSIAKIRNDSNVNFKYPTLVPQVYYPSSDFANAQTNFTNYLKVVVFPTLIRRDSGNIGIMALKGGETTFANALFFKTVQTIGGGTSTGDVVASAPFNVDEMVVSAGTKIIKTAPIKVDTQGNMRLLTDGANLEYGDNESLNIDSVKLKIAQVETPVVGYSLQITDVTSGVVTAQFNVSNGAIGVNSGYFAMGDGAGGLRNASMYRDANGVNISTTTFRISNYPLELANSDTDKLSITHTPNRGVLNMVVNIDPAKFPTGSAVAYFRNDGGKFYLEPSVNVSSIVVEGTPTGNPLLVFKGTSDPNAEIILNPCNLIQQVGNAKSGATYYHAQIKQQASLYEQVATDSGNVTLNYLNFSVHIIAVLENVVSWSAMTFPNGVRLIGFQFVNAASITYPAGWLSVVPLPTVGAVNTEFWLSIHTAGTHVLVTTFAKNKYLTSGRPIFVLPPLPTDMSLRYLVFRDTNGKFMQPIESFYQSGNRISGRIYKSIHVTQSASDTEYVALDTNNVTLDVVNYTSHVVDVTADINSWTAMPMIAGSVHLLTLYWTTTAAVNFPAEWRFSIVLDSVYPPETELKLALRPTAGGVVFVSLMSKYVVPSRIALTVLQPYPTGSDLCYLIFRASSRPYLQAVQTIKNVGGIKTGAIYWDASRRQVAMASKTVAIVGGELVLNITVADPFRSFVFVHDQDVTSFRVVVDAALAQEHILIKVTRKPSPTTPSLVFPTLTGFACQDGNGVIPFKAGKGIFIIEIRNGIQILNHVFYSDFIEV